MTSTVLEFFATEDALAALESELIAARASGTDAEQVAALVALAWQLRQRDTQRAMRLADEAEKRLGGTPLSQKRQSDFAARLQLVRAEVKWLFGEVDASQALAEGALKAFGAMGDTPNDLPDSSCGPALGCADAHWLLSWLALGQGDWARTAKGLEATANFAMGIDPVRATVAQAALARGEAFRDVVAAKQKWGAHSAFDAADLHPAAACWVADFRSVVASLSSDYVRSIRHKNSALSFALASGQTLRAITAVGNIGDNFNSLYDYDTSLEWMQRALDMARASGWPREIGAALMQTANTLRGLQRFDTAAEMLREAITSMAQLTFSRDYAIALLYLGEVELDRQQFAIALDTFCLLEKRAAALMQADLLSDALRGQAKALVELGQAEAALRAAGAALASAGSDVTSQIAALRVMADIHARNTLPPPPGVGAASVSLHYLHLALDAAATMEHYAIPGDFLATLAQEHAKVGDMGKAYELSLQANLARESIHSKEANNRASAMQVNHELEKARAEGAFHRELARAHAERAKTLELEVGTLEQLGEVGRDITCNFATDAIFSALDTHVHSLLDATTFLIYRLEPDGKTLKMVFGVEAGAQVPSHSLSLDDPQRLAPQCARERRDIVVHDALGTSAPIAGSVETVSLLYTPLLVGERLLGVMTIQSEKPSAYAEREVAIFRTLCAYGAIALANAESQAQLVESEKLVSLGSLVAGVAHELNTPIGIALTASSALEDETRALRGQMEEAGGIKRSTLDGFLARTGDVSALLVRSCQRAATLITSFKQMAVDQTSEHRRTFDLLALVEDVAASLRPSLKAATWRMAVDLPKGIACDSYPGPLGQVLTNIIQNAAVHAFEGREAGLLHITASTTGDTVEMVVTDDGNGMTAQSLAHIFDPFYTTKLGKGGSGLGMTICRNIVTGPLGGQLNVTSQPGLGSQFIVRFPKEAPRPEKP
jgi:signal transduction histidine kinase/tetratricopeptide (TPR) repeat protein